MNLKPAAARRRPSRWPQFCRHFANPTFCFQYVQWALHSSLYLVWNHTNHYPHQFVIEASWYWSVEVFDSILTKLIRHWLLLQASSHKITLFAEVCCGARMTNRYQQKTSLRVLVRQLSQTAQVAMSQSGQERKRVVFCGTPEVAASSLRRIVQKSKDVGEPRK